MKLKFSGSAEEWATLARGFKPERTTVTPEEVEAISKLLPIIKTFLESLLSPRSPPGGALTDKEINDLLASAAFSSPPSPPWASTPPDSLPPDFQQEVARFRARQEQRSPSRPAMRPGEHPETPPNSPSFPSGAETERKLSDVMTDIADGKDPNERLGSAGDPALWGQQAGQVENPHAHAWEVFQGIVGLWEGDALEERWRQAAHSFLLRHQGHAPDVRIVTSDASPPHGSPDRADLIKLLLGRATGPLKHTIQRLMPSPTLQGAIWATGVFGPGPLTEETYQRINRIASEMAQIGTAISLIDLYELLDIGDRARRDLLGTYAANIYASQ